MPDRGRASRDLGGETVSATGRFATLWVRPGPQEATTPHPLPAPPPRERRLRQAAMVGGVVAAGAALAWAAAVALGLGSPSDDRLGEASPAAPAARPAVATLPPAPEPLRSAAPAEPEKDVRAQVPKRALAAAAGQTPRSRTALVNPAPQDRRCVPRALRANPDLADRLPAELAVRLRVTAAGEIGQVEVLDVPDREVAGAVDEAVRTCRFSPGTDEEGRPVSLPIVMRIRFASPQATAGF